MCKHEKVMKIYKNAEHTQVSHYTCLNCGEIRQEKFGQTIIYSKKGEKER